MDPLQKSKEDEKEIINNNTDNDSGDFTRYVELKVYIIYILQILLSDAKKETTRLVWDIANTDNDYADFNDKICIYIVYTI